MRSSISAFAAVVFTSVWVLPCGATAGQALDIRFDKPAKSWEREALPVGNGRLGAMVFGNPVEERIQFNEISLWSGGANESGDYKVDEFGTYQSFGDLKIIAQGEYSDYARVLDLDSGIQRTTWKQQGATHTREVFASRSAEAIVVRWTADKPGQISAVVALADPRRENKGTAAADGVELTGAALPNGLRYAARARVKTDGGKSGPRGETYALENCDSVTIVLAAATDYAMDPTKNFRNGIDPVTVVADQSAKAAAQPFAKLQTQHLEGHQAVMRRVDLQLGESAPTTRAMTTPERIKKHAEGASDPELEVILFQFGRYLLASCSRPGGLPANLQGLWADGLKPAWYADYHTNINIQMNYWLAEPANLADCHEALFDWVIASIPGSRAATVKAFGEKTPGWTMRTSVNAYGGNGWQWNLPASAWLSQHFWEHYAFGGDKEFLRDKAWPIFKDVSAFWLDHLKADKNGKLIVPKGWSPEHGPREDGVAHDQQIVWDLFTNTLAAAEVLAIDEPIVTQVREARAKLLGPQIGSWGQIMEWTTERPELEKSGHRHTSHLFAVYPGNQINRRLTPEWAKAAAISLEARGTSGDSQRSWTWPWRAALWARLGEPEKAYAMVRGLFLHNTLSNLFATHPPFQMDGNFGITAGICEMLLQSHDGVISLLPALPDAWKSGAFHGLRARGGFTLQCTWENKNLRTITVDSRSGNPCQLRLPEGAKVTEKAGKSIATSHKDGVIGFPTKAGQTYQITLP